MNLYLVYFGVLQYVCAHLSAKLDSSEEAYGKVNIPLLTSKGLISLEGLDFGNGEYVVFYLLYGKAQPLLLFYNLHLRVWVHREQTPAAQPRARLPPTSEQLALFCMSSAGLPGLEKGSVLGGLGFPL